MEEILEQVEHPQHYQSCSPKARGVVMVLGVPESWLDTECIQFIEANDYFRTDWHLATAITYLWRFDQKGNPLMDLQKARWYLVRHLEKVGDGKTAGNERAIAMIDDLIATDYPHAFIVEDHGYWTRFKAGIAQRKEEAERES